VIKGVALGLVIGALFLALALWGVPLDQVGDAITHVDSAWLAVAAVLWGVQYLLRAWRQLVLIQPLAPNTTFRTQLAITLVGFFCVNTFPARLGEGVRPYLFYERDQVPFGAGLGLVFVERIIDFAALLVAMLLVVVYADLPDRRLDLFGKNVPVVELARAAAITVLPPIVLGVVALAAFGARALALGERIVAWIESRIAVPRLHRVLRLLLNFAGSFVDGVASLREPRRLVVIVFLTAVLFLAMAAFTWALACAFHFQEWIHLGEAMGVLGITMFGIALPAPPGFAGVFEAAVRAALAVFGVSGTDLAARALAFALVFHWAPYLLLSLWAGYYVWRDKIGLGRLFRFARGGSEPVEAA
jgi:uncharacterized protein (TIRG00374 family)